MAKRDNHYEAAFEAWLAGSACPTWRSMNRPPPAGRRADAQEPRLHRLAAADLPSAGNWLVDVKGRQFPTAGHQFWRNWSTADELKVSPAGKSCSALARPACSSLPTTSSATGALAGRGAVRPSRQPLRLRRHPPRPLRQLCQAAFGRAGAPYDSRFRDFAPWPGPSANSSASRSPGLGRVTAYVILRSQDGFLFSSATMFRRTLILHMVLTAVLSVVASNERRGTRNLPAIFVGNAIGLRLAICFPSTSASAVSEDNHSRLESPPLRAYDSGHASGSSGRSLRLWKFQPQMLSRCYHFAVRSCRCRADACVPGDAAVRVASGLDW